MLQSVPAISGEPSVSAFVKTLTQPCQTRARSMDLRIAVLARLLHERVEEEIMMRIYEFKP